MFWHIFVSWVFNCQEHWPGAGCQLAGADWVWGGDGANPDPAEARVSHTWGTWLGHRQRQRWTRDSEQGQGQDGHLPGGFLSTKHVKLEIILNRWYWPEQEVYPYEWCYVIKVCCKINLINLKSRAFTRSLQSIDIRYLLDHAASKNEPNPTSRAL